MRILFLLIIQLFVIVGCSQNISQSQAQSNSEASTSHTYRYSYVSGDQSNRTSIGFFTLTFVYPTDGSMYYATIAGDQTFGQYVGHLSGEVRPVWSGSQRSLRGTGKLKVSYGLADCYYDAQFDLEYLQGPNSFTRADDPLDLSIFGRQFIWDAMTGTECPGQQDQSTIVEFGRYESN